ncbi:hypothetical protein CYG49_03115 [Candidatus Saccharibacteria bacterium]|nr:MAG: hypothetical protein CYG49_03115 [Candidatus Saccharibacteria bacterium]
MIGNHIRIALSSLRASKVRTALTTLGIIIGVTAITLVLALGEGAKQAVGQQINKRGSDVITVRPGKVERNEDGKITGYNLTAAIGATTITESDLRSVQDVPGVSKAAPIMLITGSVRDGETRAKSSAIVATSPALKDVANLELRYGQFLTDKTNRQTAIIGNELAVELYGTENALGRQLTLRNQPFTIIGILKKVDHAAIVTGFDYNKSAFVSLDAGKSFNQGIAQIQEISVIPADQKQSDQVAERIENVLLRNHDGEEDFAVIRSDEAVQIANSIFRLLISITTAIASISLIVGGIGIMNIMLVNVTERTREIGIRKAIGATNGSILSQFLIEAMLMSLTGGIIGIALAYLIAIFLSGFVGYLPALSAPILLIAFSVSLFVGIIFGIFPALRAARKDPIQALRQLP